MASGTARRDRYRALADRVRAIPGKRFGLRPYRVWIVEEHWSDEDNYTQDETEIVHAGNQPPKVRILTEAERFANELDQLTVEVGPITPSHTGGGFSVADLNPELFRQTGKHFRIEGPNLPDDGAKFTLEKIETDRALHYTLTLAMADTGKELRNDG